MFTEERIYEMSIKILAREVICREINSLKEMKENNLVFTNADWEACPKTAQAVISILVLTVLNLFDDMQRMSVKSSLIRELLAMFQNKLFCPSTEQYDKVVNKPEEEKQSAKEEPSAEVITPEIPADTEEKQEKKSWARRTAGFANKVLNGLKEFVFYRNEEDKKPISEDDPEYPKDSLGNPMKRAGMEIRLPARAKHHGSNAISLYGRIVWDYSNLSGKPGCFIRTRRRKRLRKRDDQSSKCLRANHKYLCVHDVFLIMS